MKKWNVLQHLFLEIEILSIKENLFIFYPFSQEKNVTPNNEIADLMKNRNNCHLCNTILSFFLSIA